MVIAVVASTCSACGNRPDIERPSYRPGARAPVAQYASAVKIVADCATATGRDEHENGTGVIVTSTKLLTAWHVIDEPECRYHALEHDGTRHIVRMSDALIEEDIASMRLDAGDRFHNAMPVTIGQRPRTGDEICLVGMVPYTLRYCGVTQWTTDDTGDPNDVDHSIVTQPGNSGGPVYDVAGRLVAITTRYRKCINGQICGGKASSLEKHAWIAR